MFNFESRNAQSFFAFIAYTTQFCRSDVLSPIVSSVVVVLSLVFNTQKSFHLNQIFVRPSALLANL